MNKLFKISRSFFVLNSILCFTLISCHLSCKTSDKEKESLVDENQNVTFSTGKSPLYNFDWPIASEIENNIKDVYFSFYEDSKYYISNIDGKSVSDNYNEIIINKEYPFYWVKKSGKYYLYTYPHNQVIADGFDIPSDIEFARSRLSIVENIKSQFTFYTLKTNRKNKNFHPWYFFTVDSRNIGISSHAPLTYKYEMNCDNIKSSYQPTGSKYLIAFDNSCTMQLLDKNGKAISKTRFSNFEKFKNSDDYILIESEGNPQLIFDYSRKKFIEFPYKNVKPIEGLDGFFTGRHTEDDTPYEKLVLNNDGEVIYKYENGGEKIPGGLLFSFFDNTYELIDVLSGKTLFKIPKDRHGYLKDIKRIKDDFYMITTENKTFDSAGNEIEIAPWQSRPRDEKEGIINKLKSTHSLSKGIKISECIFDRYYIITINDLQGLVNTNGEFLIDLDKVKIVSIDTERFLWKGINIYKGSEEFQLNEKLELTRFPTSQLLKRVKINHSSVDSVIQNFKYWKLANAEQLRNGYLILQDDAMVHIFKTSGEFLSSHRGYYQGTLTNFSIGNYDTKRPFFSNIIELKRLEGNKTDYHIAIVR